MGTSTAKPKEETAKPEPFVTNEVQIVRVEDKTGARGGFKILHFSDGAKVYSHERTEGVTLGAFGKATVIAKTTDKGTFVNLEAWETTRPAGKVPEYSKEPNGKQVEQAVWDAKDRTIMMENAGNVAAPIVVAMITSGIVKKVEEVLAALDTVRLNQYEAAALARMDRVPTKANPHADV